MHNEPLQKPEDPRPTPWNPPRPRWRAHSQAIGEIPQAKTVPRYMIDETLADRQTSLVKDGKQPLFPIGLALRVPELEYVPSNVPSLSSVRKLV
jgi:hypothetical protein